MSNRVHNSQRDYLTEYPVTLSGDHAFIHKGRAFSLPVTISALAAAGTVTATDVDINPLYYEETY